MPRSPTSTAHSAPLTPRSRPPPPRHTPLTTHTPRPPCRAWGPLLLIPGTVCALALTERGLQAAQNWWLSVWTTATAGAGGLGGWLAGWLGVCAQVPPCSLPPPTPTHYPAHARAAPSPPAPTHPHPLPPILTPIHPPQHTTPCAEGEESVATAKYMGVYFALGLVSLLFQVRRVGRGGWGVRGRVGRPGVHGQVRCSTLSSARACAASIPTRPPPQAHPHPATHPPARRPLRLWLW